MAVNLTCPSGGRRTGSGFTLIEVMVVVVIIAILATIALPAYQEQVRKGRRSAAQAWLMELATKEQQRYTDVRSFTTDLSGWPAPTEAASFYVFTAETSGTPVVFTLTATPKSGTDQVVDGTLTLSSDGTKTPASKW